MQKKALETALQLNHIALKSEQLEQLLVYLSALNRWNGAYNLTAITDATEQIYKHVLDSLSIRAFITGETICDVGAGAGFPGIPLAIFFPEKKFTLVDSSQKKITFLRHVVITLGLHNVQAIHQRIENLHHSFDHILSRAFASLVDFVNKTRHLAQNKGQWLAMKGLYPSAELAEISGDICIKNVQELSVTGLAAKRHLVILEKR